MRKFTQNDWGQHEITNKRKLLSKQSSDTIHDAILIKYHKYTSNMILKHTNVLVGAFTKYDNTWHLKYSNPSTYNDHSGYYLWTKGVRSQ